MINRLSSETETLRDAIASLPERADLTSEVFPEAPSRKEADADLDEALRETFPASDPLSSGHIA